MPRKKPVQKYIKYWGGKLTRAYSKDPHVRKRARQQADRAHNHWREKHPDIKRNTTMDVRDNNGENKPIKAKTKVSSMIQQFLDKREYHLTKACRYEELIKEIELLESV